MCGKTIHEESSVPLLTTVCNRNYVYLSHASLHQEPQVLLECVRLLQRISQFSDHLRDLPRKTMVDLLSEVWTIILVFSV